MKNTHKIATLFVAAIMAFAGLIFSACTDNGTDVTLLESGETLVVIQAKTTNGSLQDAMAKFKEEGKLTYEGTESEYGFYLTSINGYTPDASKNEFWAVYTTLGEYEGVSYSSAEYGTYNYKGNSCASASYGISGLPIVEGYLYILTISTY